MPKRQANFRLAEAIPPVRQERTKATVHRLAAGPTVREHEPMFVAYATEFRSSRYAARSALPVEKIQEFVFFLREAKFQRHV
jgi:hypothetical protein